MASHAPTSPSLDRTDETAWLERTAEAVRAGRFEEVEAEALAEYLTDMARRDRREVFSRLVVLLAHLLKGEHQPDRRSRSWLTTVLDQRLELGQLVESGTLRHHALAVLDDAYRAARERASAETGVDRSAFPEVCPWDLPEALTRPLAIA